MQSEDEMSKKRVLTEMMSEAPTETPSKEDLMDLAKQVSVDLDGGLDDAVSRAAKTFGNALPKSLQGGSLVQALRHAKVIPDKKQVQDAIYNALARYYKVH